MAERAILYFESRHKQPFVRDAVLKRASQYQRDIIFDDFSIELGWAIKLGLLLMHSSLLNGFIRLSMNVFKCELGLDFFRGCLFRPPMTFFCTGRSVNGKCNGLAYFAPFFCSSSVYRYYFSLFPKN